MFIRWRVLSLRVFGKKVCKVEIGTEQEKLTMQLNGSQIFVEVLCEQGVDTIFGYPGGAVLNLYDELYKNADRITHVPVSYTHLTLPTIA